MWGKFKSPLASLKFLNIGLIMTDCLLSWDVGASKIRGTS